MKSSSNAGSSILQDTSRRSISTIPRWSNNPLLYHDRIKLVDRLQVHLMNHIIGGENTKKYIMKIIREEWKEKWCNVLRTLCSELYQNSGQTKLPTRNDVIIALNQAGFQFDSYMASGFNFQKLINGLVCYIFYLKHGIEICKIPRESYLHLTRNYNIDHLKMPAITKMPIL